MVGDVGGWDTVSFVEGAPAAVLAAARGMAARGLVEGTAGNISARQEDGTIVITPSAVGYSDMQVEDLVTIDLDGHTLSGRPGRTPSSERLLHTACYAAFDDVGAVIHSHPVYATMFAVTRQDIPACIDEFAIYVGGAVRCSAYAPSGTAEVGPAVVEALRDRAAALIANHGLVAVGPDPGRALHVTALVERSAHILWGARVLGPAVPLPGEAQESFASAYSFLRHHPA